MAKFKSIRVDDRFLLTLREIFTCISLNDTTQISKYTVEDILIKAQGESKGSLGNYNLKDKPIPILHKMYPNKALFISKELDRTTRSTKNVSSHLRKKTRRLIQSACEESLSI